MRDRQREGMVWMSERGGADGAQLLQPATSWQLLHWRQQLSFAVPRHDPATLPDLTNLISCDVYTHYRQRHQHVSTPIGMNSSKHKDRKPAPHFVDILVTLHFWYAYMHPHHLVCIHAWYCIHASSPVACSMGLASAPLPPTSQHEQQQAELQATGNLPSP